MKNQLRWGELPKGLSYIESKQEARSDIYIPLTAIPPCGRAIVLKARLRHDEGAA